MNGERSAYAYEGDAPELLPSFVCYADILGYTQETRAALREGRGTEYLGRLRSMLNAAYERVRAARSSWVGKRMFEVKIFTDDIVVGYPIQDLPLTLGESELGHVLDIFTELQAGLAMEGTFIRGGVALGDHYMDDDIVFGDALLEAVDLNKAGGPPRLVLSPSAVEAVQYHLGFYGQSGWSPHSEFLLRDADGEVFLNYLHAAFTAFTEGVMAFEVIEKHRDHLIENLQRFRGDPGVRSKYEWAARYHNFVCRDFAKKPYPADLEELYDETTHRLTEALIAEETLLVEPRRLDLEPIRRFAR